MAKSGITFNPDRYNKNQNGFHIFLITLSVFMGLPIVFIVNHAFKPFSELFAYPPKFFVKQPTFANFARLVAFSQESGIPISRYIFNSVFTTLIVVILSMIISSLAAFALSKLEFKGKHTLNKINQYSLMFVPVAVAIPRFLVLINIGIYNTYLAHIVPLLAMPVGLFLVKQFMDTNVPKELLEAAKIDGAGNWRIYWNIALPLVMPALVTVAILSFQMSWGYTEGSNLFVDQEALRTLPFYMSTVVSQVGNIVVTAGVGAAAQLIMFLPNLLIFIFMQNKVMASMATSGIK
ncbi:Inner membrane ABC transporter permease protein YcjP [Candidatus Izimaplasma bacterium HR1]|jgi:ABC-type glycerol-3-phosphate transport system permease component|uniref:carbohydrate ABC transporter permease n=1 Tax=Candidatus Izimoplasma sp. HR1 TaxID=1541959 RepID=UPI0004F7CE81|nr:Inner membrane ABC transporter permease protein YcjP [Candidatus Izimaplasma bacterium HR1]